MRKKPEMLGDGPIEPKHRETMNAVARGLDDVFNGKDRTSRKVGFVLMVFPYDSHDGRCNYISNGANRKDVVALMKEMIARFEGFPEQSGRA